MVAGPGSAGAETEADGRPNGPAPILRIAGTELVFHVDGRDHHVKLEEIVALGDQGLIPLLLYALVLNTANIDQSLRLALQAAKDQTTRITAAGVGLDENFMEKVIAQLQKSGLMPKPPEETPGS